MTKVGSNTRLLGAVLEAIARPQQRPWLQPKRPTTASLPGAAFKQDWGCMWWVTPLTSSPVWSPVPTLWGPNKKGCPTQVLLFPLYCSSAELEMGLDLQQHAKRLRWWGGVGGHDLAEKANRSERKYWEGIKGVVTMTPEDINHTIRARKGTERGNGHNSGFSHAPSTHMEATFQNGRGGGKWLPRKCPSTPWFHICPHIHTTTRLLPFDKLTKQKEEAK